MARMTGPKHKLCRRAGVALCGSPNCPALKRPYPPGQHGQSHRRKQSEYGTQLLEKQKLKHMYAVSEKQFRRYYEEAARRHGITGENLLQQLETRLDNLVYRLGFGRTIHAARQIVTHGHITVNGRRVDIPSYAVHPGDTISLTEKSRQLKVIDEALQSQPVVPPYLSYDNEQKAGHLLRWPARAEIPVQIQESLIVEYFSR